MVRCTHCGAEQPAGAKYCHQCAAALAPGSASEPVATDPILAYAGQADRRPVTVLFADISGFTSLSEKLDPEAVQDLIGACFERVVPCIERYGGTVDKFIGDEVMALFGAPQAHENDPERALHAALEMREALADFNRERGADLSIHFGVNTGLVYAGEVGGGSRHDYSVMGDAVNVASRLKAAAGPGEILVGADTYHQTKHLLDFERAEALRLKGKTEPVSVCRLLCARTAMPREERLSRGLSSALVGREAEMTSFHECVARLRTDQGAILILTGEAGLGKSRLVAEVRTQAKNEGVLWLEGRALSFGRTISYWPLLEIIQQDAGIESDDPEAERWNRLAARVGHLFAEDRDEILPYLATLLSISLPEDLAQKVRLLDGEAMGRQIYRACRLYFDRLAKEHPTVIVFEDLHWLDGSSASLLEHLLPLTRESPLLLCLVSRPEADSPLPHLQELTRTWYSERLAEIDLAPLSHAESATLACNLANLDGLPPHLQEAITARTEGNPFYVEEVVRSLIDQGGLVLDQTSGRYRVTEKAVHISIPDTLLGVITARIDRLEEDLRHVLRLASVVGRTFFYRVLAAIAEAEEELDKGLEDLEERELIREKARLPELEYIFKHALVQEATYESILLARRKELHLRVAEVIEALFVERLEEFYSLLAYHYSRAEDWEKAQDYLFKAGDQAGSIAADAEAFAHYEQALEAYTRAFGDKWDPLERAILERKMGEALYRHGEHERALEYIHRALALLGSPFPTSPGGLGRAIVGQLLIQLGHRIFWWLPRRSPTPESVRIAEERLRLHDFMSWANIDQSWLLLNMLVGANTAESAGIEWRAAGWYGVIIFICDVIPLQRTSRYYYRRCARWVEEGRHGDSREEREMLGWDLAVLGMHEHLVGECAKAFDRLHSARNVCLAVGDARKGGVALDQLSHLLVDRGDLGEALDLCQGTMALGRASGDRVAEAWAQMDVGHVLVAQGEFEKAEAILCPAAQQLVVALDPGNAAKAKARISHCYLKQGRLEEARTILAEEAVRLWKNGVRGYFARNVRTGNAAACLLALERTSDGDKKHALKEAKSTCRDLLKHGKADDPSLVTGYRMQGTYEWLRGRPSKAAKWWGKSLEHAEKLGARYEEALTRLEIGRRTGDRAALEMAEAAFTEMGAAWDLTEARGLLGRPEVVQQAVAS